MGRRPRRLDHQFCCLPERRESDQRARPGASDSDRQVPFCFFASAAAVVCMVDIKPSPNVPLSWPPGSGRLFDDIVDDGDKQRPSRQKGSSACHPAPLLVLQGPHRPSDDLSSETVAPPNITDKDRQMADAAGLIRAGGARGEISSRQSARPLAGVSSSSFARRLDVASSSRDCHGMNSHVGT